jgi:hypothetical protein
VSADVTEPTFLVQGLSTAPMNGNVNQPDGLRSCSAVRPGDARDSYRDVGSGGTRRTLSHRTGDGSTDRTLSVDHRSRNAQEFTLGHVRISDETALDHIRCARDFRQRCNDEPAGRRFSGDEPPSTLAELNQQQPGILDEGGGRHRSILVTKR